MSRWHPISTAPRDGTEVLAWYPEGRWGDDEDNQERMGIAFISAFGAYMGEPKFSAIGYEGSLPFGEPTLWQPFEPPSP